MLSFSARKKNRQYDHLYKKWTKKHKQLHDKLITKHGQTLAHVTHTLSSHQVKAGMLGGLMLLSMPGRIATPSYAASQNSANEQQFTPDSKLFVVTDLASELPEEVRPLTSNENSKISKILSRDYGINVTPQLQGISLNTTYGLIGAEQHLARFPGDTMDTHLETQIDRDMYYDSGMAPGLGAWGYFANSQSAFTEEDKLREKYYIAVQTFLAQGYNTSTSDHYNFFKYRKMLVVNPYTGQAVVCDIGDAGPAEWTGKTLGGSPEVMYYLGLYDGPRKGPVLYYFIDDPSNKVPLGPVNNI